MLNLTRNKGETLVIELEDEVRLVIMDIDKWGVVRIGIDAPQDVHISRSELQPIGAPLDTPEDSPVCAPQFGVGGKTRRGGQVNAPAGPPKPQQSKNQELCASSEEKTRPTDREAYQDGDGMLRLRKKQPRG